MESSTMSYTSDVQWDLVSRTPLTHLNFVFECFMPRWHQQITISGNYRQFKDQTFQQMIQLHQDANSKVIFTGSFYENVSIPYYLKRKKHQQMTQPQVLDKLTSQEYHQQEEKCDIDTMMEVVGKKVGQGGHYLRKVETDHTRPGYLRIRYTDDIMAMYCVSKDNKVYLSSSLIMAEYTKLPSNTATEYLEFHGPAITIMNKVTLDNDFVMCLHSPEWPREAEEWKTRDRPSGWPPKNLRNDILALGYHVVPVAHRQSTWKEAEWRFSFAQAETKLCHSLSLNQRRCYMLVKFLAKRELVPSGLVTSYCLKNLFYRVMEKIPQQKWENNIYGFAKAFLSILDHLIEVLINHNLPHYFISQNNLISHIPKHCIVDLLVSVTKIRRNPIQCLFDFDKTFMFQYSPWNTTFSDVLQPITYDPARPTSYNMIDCHQQQLLCLISLFAAYQQDCQFDGEQAILEKIFQIMIFYQRKSFDPSVYSNDLGLQQSKDLILSTFTHLTNRYPEAADQLQQRMKNLGTLMSSTSMDTSIASQYLGQTRQLAQPCPIDPKDGKALDYATFLRTCGCSVKAIPQLLKIIDALKNSKETRKYDSFDKQLLDENLQDELKESLDGLCTYYYIWAHYQLVFCYIETKQKDKASEVVESFSAACQDLSDDNASDSLAFALLGYSYKALGQFENATDSFAKALLRRSDYTLADNNKLLCDTLALSLSDDKC